MVRARAQTVTTVELDGRTLPFASLAATPVSEGRHTVSFSVAPIEESRLILAPCAGKVPPEVTVDGQVVATAAGPHGQRLTMGPGAHRVELTLMVSGYEKRVACGFAPRLGPRTASQAGLRVLHYPSTRPKGSCTRCRPGHALVYVPHSVADDSARQFPAGPPPVLLGLHPWNGALETYAAYMDLLDAAEARGVVLLFADGLGNSLYTAPAEAEVLAALEALRSVLPIDAERVSIFGASMGGAGATTVAFHHPDLFASATSLFGDAKYDLSTYVRSLIPNEEAAKRVNALDVVDNARNLPLFLVHGDADKSSNIKQSILLDRAMKKAGFFVQFDPKPGRGHEGALVSEYAKAIVERAATLKRVHPSRITYRSFRSGDLGAYGLTFVKARPDGEAFVDVERTADQIVVHQASGVTSMTLDPGTFAAQLPIVLGPGVAKVSVGWAPK